jgi:hypothetical protein
MNLTTTNNSISNIPETSSRWRSFLERFVENDSADNDIPFNDFENYTPGQNVTALPIDVKQKSSPISDPLVEKCLI